MSTKFETTVGDLPQALSGFPGDRSVFVVVEDSAEEKIAALNAGLSRSRAAKVVDGEEALHALRDEFLAQADALPPK